MDGRQNVKKSKSHLCEQIKHRFMKSFAAWDHFCNFALHSKRGRIAQLEAGEITLWKLNPF